MKQRQAAGREASPDRSRWEAEDPDVVRMLRVRDGDTGAFRDLFDRHGEALANFTYRFVSNRARAEELAQDAFLQIFRARRRYQPKARFVTYLYRVATNLCLNELRRFEYRGKVEPLEGKPSDDASEGQRQIADEALPTAEESVAGQETAGRIEEVLGKLPENQRTALLLSRVEGFSYEEVAETLDTTVSAVKSLIFRATRTLRDDLEDLLEAES